MNRRLLPLLETAEMLGKSEKWFQRHKQRLMAEENFPPPVKGMGQVWDSAAIFAWLDDRIDAKYKTRPVETPRSAEDLNDWNRIFIQRLQNAPANASPPQP